MTSGLTVALSTAARYLHVTRQVEELEFRSVAPGGYASATITLHRPLNLTPDELAYYGLLYVYDGRNGNIVWEGRVEDFGRGADGNGQIWTVNAVGAMAHARDVTGFLIYQDQQLASWQPAPGAPPALQLQSISTTTLGSGLQALVPRDAVVAVGSLPAWGYSVMGNAGLNLAQITIHYGEDFTDTNWQWDLNVVPTPGGTSTTAYTRSWVAGSSANMLAVVTTNMPTGSKYATLQLRRTTSSTTVANDTNAVSWVAITVRSTIFDRYGNESFSPATYATNLKASEVVADVLGRMCARYDGANAVIDTSQDFSFTGQLSYDNGTTSDQVLADMMTLLPGMYWSAWESNDAGLYRFEWKPWPTTIRYDATAVDGFSAPSSASGLYDAVLVRWVDPTGATQTTTCSLVNATLQAGNLHRTALIDLGSAVTGTAAATQAGNQFLTDAANPSAGGTLTVARPIFDRVLGHTVMPWEILPGYLVRVRNVAPTVAADSDRDGISTFRVVSTTYNDATTSATLELDAPSVSFVNAVAALQANQTYQVRN